MAKKSLSEQASVEEQRFFEALRARGKVIEAETEDIALPPGVTHVLVRIKGRKPRLVEKRKSLF